MTTVRDLIQRDIGVSVEGVVKVFDRDSLATEMREYVVTDKIEDELKHIFDTFTQVSETLRHSGQTRDVMGMWVSGFFGSGKSHFAKVLGHLFQNTQLDELGSRVLHRCVRQAPLRYTTRAEHPAAPRRTQAEHRDLRGLLRDQESPALRQA